MQITELSATRRAHTGKGPNRRLRARGLVPAVVYGQGRDNIALAIDPRPVVTALMEPAGRNRIFRLLVDGQDEGLALVRDYQIHPVTRRLLHLDFLRVLEDRAVVIEVPVRLVGRSEAAKAGGRDRLVARAIKVRCLPKDIPPIIEYDVSPIVRTTVVYVADLQLPDGVEAVYRRNFPVIAVTAARVVEAEAGGEGEAEAG